MAEESDEYELADATKVRVLETNLLHASDVIYWLDGSSAATPVAMSRIETPLNISFSEKPKAIRFLHSLGKSAFWQTPTEPMHQGTTTDAERTRPVQDLFDVSGAVYDPQQQFNPAAFAATLGAGNGHGVVLYPTPLGVKHCAGGVVQGRVIKAGDGQPLIWGVLTLVVTVGIGETATFVGQTDAKGDFRMALKRLPPLPLNTAEYSATLSIVGDMEANADSPADTTEFVALEIESAAEEEIFSQQVAVTVRPGVTQRINSMNKLFIAVQTV